MDQSGFDDLAKALSDGAGSRRRVLQVAGATLIGAPLLALFPRSAAGGAKKRCKKIHGEYLPSGECRCTVTWRKGQQAPHKFRCENTDGCGCYQTVDGSGFARGGTWLTVTTGVRAMRSATTAMPAPSFLVTPRKHPAKTKRRAAMLNSGASTAPASTRAAGHRAPEPPSNDRSETRRSVPSAAPVKIARLPGPAIGCSGDGWWVVDRTS